MFENPKQADPQCWAKTSLAKALKDLGHSEARTFLRGLQHIQMEAVWGGEEDSAPVLRGTCALALVQCADLSRNDKFKYLIPPLTESQPAVRRDAVRALEQMEGLEAILLLHLKARAGDSEASVTGQVFESLLRLEREGAIPFVAAFLASPVEEVREEAALALGASRFSSAIPVLKEAWTMQRRSGISEVFLQAISASRQEPAIDFLLNLIRNGDTTDAVSALRALELHKNSIDIRRQIGNAVEARGDIAIGRAFRERFTQ